MPTRSTPPQQRSPDPARTPASHVATGLRGSIVAATIVAAVLRLFRLGHPSLWADEILTWHSVRTDLPMDPARMIENVHGPLYALVLHAWCGIAGDAEWALRLPSAVFGALAVPVIATLAARWLGREAAAPAAWLAAGSPFLVWYGQEARNYSMLILCSATASAGLVSLRERLRPAPLAVALAASAAGLLSNFSFALLAPIQLRWWLGEGPGRGRRLAVAGGVLALLLVVALPWLGRAFEVFDWARLVPGRAVPAGETALREGTTFHPAAVPFAFHAFAVGYTLGPPLRALRADSSIEALRPFAPEIAATAAVFGILTLLAWRSLARRRRLLDAALWIGVPLLVVCYFAIQNFKVFHPRYLAIVMPGLVAAWAVALADLRPRARLALAGAIVALWAVSLSRHYADPRYAKEDLRGAAALVASRWTAGERVIAANTADMLVYYLRGRLPVEHYWLGFASDTSRMARRFEELRAGSAAWVVLARPEDLDRRGAFAAFLDRSHPGAERTRFEGVTVWHLPAGPPAGRSGVEANSKER